MEFLRELFNEPLSYEAFAQAIKGKGIKLADLSKGSYVDKDKLTKAEESLKNANDTIGTLTSELNTLKNSNASAEDWKRKFEDLQDTIKKKEEKEASDRADLELTKRIEAVIGDAKFTSDYAKAGLIADMKAEITKPENKGKGDSEIYEALTKDKEGIFANPNPPGDMGGIGGVDKGIEEDQIRNIMGLPIK